MGNDLKITRNNYIVRIAISKAPIIFVDRESYLVTQ